MMGKCIPVSMENSGAPLSLLSRSGNCNRWAGILIEADRAAYGTLSSSRCNAERRKIGRVWIEPNIIIRSGIDTIFNDNKNEYQYYLSSAKLNPGFSTSTDNKSTRCRPVI